MINNCKEPATSVVHRLFAALAILLLVAGCQTTSTSQRPTFKEVRAMLSGASLEPGMYGNEDQDWGISPTDNLRKYRFHASTPKTVPGAHVIRTTELLRKLQTPTPPILIDVLSGKTHSSLPGAIWLKNAGIAGAHDHQNMRRKLEAKLTELTGGNRSRQIVMFCLSSKCWLSYNAALRAARAGYTNVFWYRGGNNAWKAAGLPTVTVSWDNWNTAYSLLVDTAAQQAAEKGGRVGSVGTAAKGQTGAKPSIFIAYPKDGNEIADREVSLLGYVTSANLTKKVKVIVNGFSLDLDDLWNSSAIDTADLRGFPLDLKVPLQDGDNQIEIQITDKAGFLERNIVSVKRIEIKETAAVSLAGLPSRLTDIAVAQRSGNVSAENFITVLGGWVKDTAKSDYNKGNTMFDQGRFARATYYYRKSIKTEPLGQAWFNLGISEQAQGYPTKASEAFTTACRMKVSQAC